MIRKLAIICFAIYTVLYIFDLDTKLYSFASILRTNAAHSINISNYEVDIEAKEIAVIEDNLSGITYNAKSDTLFVIINSPRAIYELTKTGEVLRKIELYDFKDTEGIVHLKDNRFAIVDERKKGIYILDIPSEAKKLYMKDVVKKFNLRLYDIKNSGFEGVAYDQSQDNFYIVNEKAPVEIIKLSNWYKEKAPMSITIEDTSTILTPNMSDFSGLHFDYKTKHLLVLSDESQRIIEIDKENSRISFLNLKSGYANLNRSIPQAEGVTMDNDGYVYVVSEPNFFYRFKSSM